MTKQIQISRDDTYAHMIAPTYKMQLLSQTVDATYPLDALLFDGAQSLLSAAIAAKSLRAPYVDVDRKHRGSALNYELYDVALNRAGRVVAALYQVRETTCTKYGNSPQKEYAIISALPRSKKVSVRVLADAQKIRVVRLARKSLLAGEVIEVLTRETKQAA